MIQEESWNLDPIRLAKLQRITQKSLEERNSKVSLKHLAIAEATKRIKSYVIRVEQFLEEKKKECVESRFSNSSLPIAVNYTRLGDDYQLKIHIQSTGYDVNKREPLTGRTLLHEAITSKHYHIVKLLVEKFKSNVNIPTLLGTQSPLHLAVDLNLRQMVSLFITYGANLNAKDSHGSTPLHFVRSHTVAKLLLKQPEIKLLRNKQGESPYQYYITHTPELDRLIQIEDLLRHREETLYLEKVRQEEQFRANPKLDYFTISKLSANIHLFAHKVPRNPEENSSHPPQINNHNNKDKKLHNP